MWAANFPRLVAADFLTPHHQQRQPPPPRLGSTSLWLGAQPSLRPLWAPVCVVLWSQNKGYKRLTQFHRAVRRSILIKPLGTGARSLSNDTVCGKPSPSAAWPSHPPGSAATCSVLIPSPPAPLPALPQLCHRWLTAASNWVCLGEKENRECTEALLLSRSAGVVSQRGFLNAINRVPHHCTQELYFSFFIPQDNPSLVWFPTCHCADGNYRPQGARQVAFEF